MGKLLFFLLLATNASFAQNTLLTGRIVDVNNKPVAGAVIKVVTGKKIIETTADKDGLYYTKLFPAGKYHVRIHANNKSYKVNEITVAARDKEKWFYNFQLTGSKAVVHIDEQDPFMEVAFNKIEAKQHLNDLPVGSRVWCIKYATDSNEFGKTLDSSSIAIPEESKIGSIFFGHIW
jgi:hypothetical protein